MLRIVIGELRGAARLAQGGAAGKAAMMALFSRSSAISFPHKGHPAAALSVWFVLVRDVLTVGIGVLRGADRTAAGRTVALWGLLMVLA
jgi:hypothetical protein